MTKQDRKAYISTAYQVTSLPDVPFDVGELYSGNIPIDTANASRALFFVFEPTIGDPVDEVTIWYDTFQVGYHLRCLTDHAQAQWRPGMLQLRGFLPGGRQVYLEYENLPITARCPCTDGKTGPGTFQPVVNDYSWVNLTNMLW